MTLRSLAPCHPVLSAKTGPLGILRQALSPPLGLALLLALCALSCRKPDQPAKTTSAGTNRQVYEVKGVVRDVIADKRKIQIQHEKIPDYMEAMTMFFDVKDASKLDGLKPGDNVLFRMVVTGDDGWIEEVKKLDEPRTPLPEPAPSLRRVREVEALAVGDKMPNYVFTNTLGNQVSLDSYQGNALAITFIFTRCPFPTYCPRLSGNFAEAQAKMAALADAPTNWHLFSITIDPEYDTPERLKAYAKRYNADPRRWEFVTGDLIDITAISEQFGLQFWRAKPSDPITHNLRTVVVDAAGRVQWITVENEWTASTLVEQLVRAARVKKE
jgi:protein SCO1/2